MWLKLSRKQLKWLIAITMLMDHLGVVFFCGGQWKGLYYFLRGIGRISFPLVCFCLVEGFYHTHSRKRYALRLLVFALLSEVPFDLAILGSWANDYAQNVLFTLLIGLLVMTGLEPVVGSFAEKRSGEHRGFLAEHIMVRKGVWAWIWIVAVVAFGMAAAWFLRTDYSFWGVLLILVFYIGGKLPVQIRQEFLMMGVVLVCGCQSLMELLGVLALPVIACYIRGQELSEESQRHKVWRLFFYFFYPLHLLLLAVIAR